VQIGIVAPSSRVPQIELKLGVELLKQEGFEIQVHKQCARHHRYLAGTDEERAQAFVDYALDPSIDGFGVRVGGMEREGFCHFLRSLRRESRFLEINCWWVIRTQPRYLNL
jgi:muramoyltetrapeptide carboxypeptidase LdcA involved in peptidoglycan recycling